MEGIAAEGGGGFWNWGLLTSSRTGTLTNVVDGVGDGSLLVMSPEQAGVGTLPPPSQHSTEGSFNHVPHQQQTHQQLLFTPEALLHPQWLPI